MKIALSSFALLCLFCTPPAKAQALTLDQLFWLRERPEADNADYLAGEHGWHCQPAKDVIISDSIELLTTWFFQDAHKKRLAEVVYESRNSVASITYSTSNRVVFNAIKARLAAYHMQYVGQKQGKGVAWTYFRYENDFDVRLAVYSTPKAAHPTWYTVVIHPRWR